MHVLQDLPRSFPLFPLKVTLVTSAEGRWAGHSIDFVEGDEMNRLFKLLVADIAVREAHWTNDEKMAVLAPNNFDRNTIVLALDKLRWNAAEYILTIREQQPNIAFVLYGSKMTLNALSLRSTLVLGTI